MASPAFDRWWSHFVETGDICPLRLGMSRQQVMAVLGAPDVIDGKASAPEYARILRYEPLEFHFGAGPDAVLFLIYADDAHGVVRVSIGGWRPRLPP